MAACTKEPIQDTAKLPAFLESNRILSAQQMADFLGLSLAHFRRLYRTGKIPAPIRIGARKVGWRAHVATEMVGARNSAAA